MSESEEGIASEEVQPLQVAMYVRKTLAGKWLIVLEVAALGLGFPVAQTFDRSKVFLLLNTVGAGLNRRATFKSCDSELTLKLARPISSPQYDAASTELIASINAGISCELVTYNVAGFFDEEAERFHSF